MENGLATHNPSKNAYSEGSLSSTGFTEPDGVAEPGIKVTILLLIMSVVLLLREAMTLNSPFAESHSTDSYSSNGSASMER